MSCVLQILYCATMLATTTTPEKLFFCVPRDSKSRKKWCSLMRRDDPRPLSTKSTLHCCDDHFDGLLTWWFLFFWSAESLVLDPALYLSPSPPLTATLEDTQWIQPRFAADLAVIPLRQIETTTTTPEPTATTTDSSTLNGIPEASNSEMIDKSDKLLQLLRTSKPTIVPYLGIHVPLTFSLTGTYGRYGGSYGSGNVGVIGSSYGSVSDVEGDPGFSSLYGKEGLAGSSYGSYGGYAGTRIYGTSSGAAWSGWGNGKWGHYGKG